jgi:RHS repeat-associated protein
MRPDRNDPNSNTRAHKGEDMHTSGKTTHSGNAQKSTVLALIFLVALGGVSPAAARYYCDLAVGGQPDPRELTWLPWLSYCATEQSMPSSPDYYIVDDYPRTDITDCVGQSAERQRQIYLEAYPGCAVTMLDTRVYTIDEAPLGCNGNVDPKYYVGFFIEAYEGTWEIACPGLSPVTHLGNFGGKYFVREPVGDSEVVAARNFGQPQCGLVAGNPINIATGNKYQQRQDLSLPGGLKLVRHYNSGDPGSHGFGPGWRGSFSRRIDFLGPHDQASLAIILTRDDGRVDHWRVDAAVVVPPPDARGRLEATYSEGRIVGFTYREEGILETYGPQGRLMAVENDKGDRLTLAYEEGMLAAVTNANGRSLAYVRDAAAQVQRVIADDGSAWAYRYDPKGRLAQVVFPDGMTETYHYENPEFPNALTGMTDERGHRIRSWAYDEAGRAVLGTRGEIQSPIGRHVIHYHPDGSVTTTGPLQHSIDHRFQVDHGVARFAEVSAPCDACSNRANSITRDDNGNRDMVTDFRGHQSDYDYSADNLLEMVTEAVGTPQQRQTAYEWDPVLRKPIRIIQDGKTTGFTYNSRGQVLTRTVTDPQAQKSRRWVYTYHEPPSGVALIGKLKSIDGPRLDVNDLTVYEYYDNDHAAGDYRAGDLRAVINPLGHRVRWLKYDANGRPLVVSDANDVLVSLSWHPRGWVSARSVDGAETRYEYDGAGNLLRLTHPDGHFLDYRYDELNRLVALSDSLGNQIEYTLDEQGNRIAEETRDAAGALRRMLERQYDALGRLEALIDGRLEATGFAYDDAHDLVSVRDANGNVTDFAYDALGRRFAVIDALMGKTITAHDAQDRPLSIVDPIGSVTEFTHDGLGNRLRIRSADSGTSVFEYDEAGNRTAARDARGVRREFHYDALNRLIRVTFPDAAQDIRFEYDGGVNGLGRLTRMLDAAGVVDYEYDTRGNLISETRDFGTHAYQTTYAYDAADRLVQIGYPGGLVIDRITDASGRVAAIFGPDGVLAEEIRYEPFGPLRSFTYGNGLQYSAEFNPNYAVEQLRSGPGLDWSLSRDPAGNVLGIVDGVSAALDQAFVYDPLHRLVSAVGAYGSLLFGLDANGNRIRREAGAEVETLGYEPGTNRLLSQGPWVMHRDESGNRSRKVDADGLGQASIYGDHGRLVRISARSGETETLLGEYVYDGFGRRVIKSSDGRITHYVYGPTGQLLGEYVPGGDTDQREYVYLEGAPVAIVVRRSERQWPAGLDRIVDNGDPGTRGSGNWRRKSGSQAWGADYLLANRAAGSYYRWTTVLPAMDYTLYAWWSDKNNQSADVFYTVSDEAGPGRTVTRSHKQGGGRWQLLGQYRSAGGPHSVEVRSGSNRFVADAIRWTEITDPVEVVVEESYYLHFDHLATPRRVTDQSQAIVWRWDSSPFGLVRPDEDPDGDGKAFSLNLRFAGQYHDEESGLRYNHFRTYDPTAGRFLEPDPIGLEGGMNPFAHALGNPVRLADPQGLLPVGEWISQPKFNIADYGVTGVTIISPYLDEWGFLKVFRVHGFASGYVNLDVSCRDWGECARREWEVHERIGLSYGGYKDLGPNLIAAGAGTTAGPLAGAATGILTFGGSAMTAMLEILREVESRGGDKIQWLYEMGPTAICVGIR